MATRMQQRRGTAAQWTAANPILAAGEIGFETDTNKFKMGNGSSTWTALQYFANAAELAAIVDGAPGLLNTLNELAAAIGDDPAFFITVGTNLETHTSSSTNIHGIANTALLVTSAGLETSLGTLSSTLSGNLSTHESDTQQVHGISNTANLVYATDLSTHNSATENVHGISDTAELITQTQLSAAIAAEALVTAGDLSTHESDTLAVHGISNTANLVYATDLSTHAAETANVHGIADTTALVTQTQLTNAISGAEVDQSALAGNGLVWDSADGEFDVDTTIISTKSYADTALTDHNSDTSNVHGIADTAALATKVYADNAVTTHNNDTTDVHGIADTSILATTTGTQTLSNKTLTTPTINGPTITAIGQTPTIHGIYLPDSHSITFEGATANEFETVLTVTDPTADRTVSLPDASGTLQLRVANVSDTEIGYLDGVTSAIQTQIDAKAPKSAPTFTGTVTSSNDLVVDGNLTVNGTTFNASSTSITIEDNIVQLAHQNPANTVDLGLVVAYNDGAAKHSGLVRDVSDDEWKLFKGVTSEPTTTVNFGQGSLDNLELNNLVAAGVVFTDGTQTKEGVQSRTPIIAKTDSYTLSALTERDSLVEVAKATATTITIPTDATLNFPIGTSIDILQTSTGQVTIAGAAGVTVNATPGLKLRTTWSSATLFKRAANTWVVYGDLTA